MLHAWRVLNRGAEVDQWLHSALGLERKASVNSLVYTLVILNLFCVEWLFKSSYSFLIVIIVLWG